MSEVVNEWQPDTCECILIYTYDEAAKTFSLKDWRQKCALQQNLEGDDLFNAVLEHNRGFNLFTYDAADPMRNEELRRLAKASEKAKNPAAVTKKAEPQTQQLGVP